MHKTPVAFLEPTKCGLLRGAGILRRGVSETSILRDGALTPFLPDWEECPFLGGRDAPIPCAGATLQNGIKTRPRRQQALKPKVLRPGLNPRQALGKDCRADYLTKCSGCKVFQYQPPPAYDSTRTIVPDFDGPASWARCRADFGVGKRASIVVSMSNAHASEFRQASALI